MSPSSLNQEEMALPEASLEAAGPVSMIRVNSDEIQKEFVDWDGPDDPIHPVNWLRSKRWTHIILIATSSLIPNLATTMIAPGIEGVVTECNIQSTVISTFAVTIYLLGLALGPICFASLSEAYGRLPVYHASQVVFIAFVIGNALSRDTAQFLVFRFLSGCAGGMPLALGGGIIADITLPHKRSVATMLLALGPLAGPVLGPVIGGFLAAAKGWRWTFWLLTILAGANEMATLIWMRETSPKILLERKTAQYRAATGNANLMSRLSHKVTPGQVFTQALVRPSIMLIRYPIFLLLSLYTALVFGVLYLLFTSFNAIFRGQYGFSTSVAGLPYLGVGIALVSGIGAWNWLDPLILASRMKADDVVLLKPEYRLPLMILLSPSIAVGLFIFGWTAQYRVHWIFPIIGTCFIGFGAYFVLMPAQLYLIQLFGSDGAASALGACNLVRYLGGTFLPLAGPRLFASLGFGWGCTLLGFVSLLFVLPPIYFYKFGERLRLKGQGVQ